MTKYAKIRCTVEGCTDEYPNDPSGNGRKRHMRKHSSEKRKKGGQPKNDGFKNPQARYRANRMEVSTAASDTGILIVKATTELDRQMQKLQTALNTAQDYQTDEEDLKYDQEFMKRELTEAIETFVEGEDRHLSSARATRFADFKILFK